MSKSFRCHGQGCTAASGVQQGDTAPGCSQCERSVVTVRLSVRRLQLLKSFKHCRLAFAVTTG
eukprot:6172693-Pleurochrysis_carterae.AAC.3